ncbi:putative nuclease HARBI1 [Zeugodacus cucurbitae]|uniref:putative nuclease HARBI1 n=1 Tax=Zeugodacus cucurbitae TaxID=28588 RepID=UPI0023D91CE5|nr:putative nuclease HARBI1 [Zeugodacus cucurbitae]
MEDDIFYSHFRMRRSTFKRLMTMLQPMWTESSTGRTAVSMEKALYLTIWKLANNTSFRQISDRFDVGMGATYRAFIKILKLICRLKSTIIKFPTTTAAQKKIADGFSQRRHSIFPFVLGCIDGTHIPISQPKNDAISFYNRKGTFSIIAQAIVDSDMKFLDVFVSCPGRCHDASVWQRSPFRRALVSGELKIPPNHHFLGDAAYPLETFLMVPYRDNGFLTSQQSKFNTILSTNRVYVEQAFGILKQKFRILKFIGVQLAHIPKIIVLTCMIIHNVIIINEGQQNIDWIELDEEEAQTSEVSVPSLQRDEAQQKRNALATLFSS